MRLFTISIEIAAPTARVWEVMSDVERWYEWTPSITSARRLGTGAFAVGSRVMVRQPKFPPALWTVSVIEPGRGFIWVSAGPGLRAIGRHSVEATANGSRVTLSLEFQGLFGGAFARLTRKITERYIAFEAAGLKARSENPEFRIQGRLAT